MGRDIIVEGGGLFLGSRLKRLGERMQADVAQLVESLGLPVQPSHYPVLAAIEEQGTLSVNDLAGATGFSQPATTRSIGQLEALGLVTLLRNAADRRQKNVALTALGKAVMARSRAALWPMIRAGVENLCDGSSTPLLSSIASVEQAMAKQSLLGRCLDDQLAPLSLRPFTPELAPVFHDLNVEWISEMFSLEKADRDVLENPLHHLIEPGGDILFVQTPDLGLVGTAALRHAGDGVYELTKMCVTRRARGRGAGGFLLAAIIARAQQLKPRLLYLLTSSKCDTAIRLYEQMGFAHDAQIMADYGARYARCNVAMRFTG